MIRKDIKTQFRNGLAKKVGWDPEHRLHAHILNAQLQQSLSWAGAIKGKKVLDIGIASGRFVREFCKKEAEVFGLDVSPIIIEDVDKYLHSLNLSAKLLLGDAENLPFADDLFDVINCQEVLIHLPNQSRGLAEMKRVLKPGGLLIADVTNKFGLYSLYHHYFKRETVGRMLQIVTKEKGISHNTVAYRTKNVFLKLLLENELEILHVIGFGFLPPMGLICPKSVSEKFGSHLDKNLGNVLPSFASFIMILATK